MSSYPARVRVVPATGRPGMTGQVVRAYVVVPVLPDGAHAQMEAVPVSVVRRLVRPSDGRVLSLAAETDHGAVVLVRRVVLRHADRLPHELLLASGRARRTEHLDDAAGETHVEAPVDDGVEHAVE